MALIDEGENVGLHQYPPFNMAKERLASLPRKQALLARILLDEPEVIAFGSIREVAARLDVNAATVLRFAQILGYTGYQALQSAVRQAYLRYAGLQPPPEQRLLVHEGTVLGHLYAQQRLDLDRLYERLDEQGLQALCDRIERARRVLVCGEGTSLALGTLFVRLLEDVGIAAIAVAPGPVDSAITTLDLSAEDAVVAVSLGVAFRSVASIVRRGRHVGASTLVITDPAGSATVPLADRTIVVPGQGLGLSVAVAPTAALLETLTALLAERRPEETVEHRQLLLARYAEDGLLAHGRRRRQPDA